MVINPIVGVYIPIITMTIPNIGSLEQYHLVSATDLYPAFLSMSTEEKNEIVPDDPTQAGEKRFFCILGFVIVGFIHFHTK